MALLEEILHPQVILESVTTRIKRPGDALQKFFHMEIGGSAVIPGYGRTTAYDIYDHIRDVASARAPGAPAGTLAANPVAQVPITFVRLYEKIPLYYERISNTRTLGKPSSQIDRGGADYITRQEGTLKEYFMNAREFMVAGMMRGSFQYKFNGDKWDAVFTGGTYTVDMQMPAGNKSQLNMTGAGNIIGTKWSDTTNALVFDNILSIDAAFWQLHGYGLKHIWCNSIIWGYVTNNAGIKARSGSANVVFTRFERAPQGLQNDGEPAAEWIGELRCLPGIVWHIYNGGVNIQGTFTKFFGDTQAVFCPEPDPSGGWAAMLTGSEYVVESKEDAAHEVSGLYFWPQYTRDPARIDVMGVDNLCPVLRVPKAMAFGTVDF